MNRTNTQSVCNIKVEPTLDDDKSLATKSPVSSDRNHNLKEKEESGENFTVEMISEKDDTDPDKLMDDLLEPLCMNDLDEDGLLPELMTNSDLFGGISFEPLGVSSKVSQASSSMLDDDVSTLMTGDILELTTPDPDETYISQVDIIGRIMTCIHHESNPSMLRKAEIIVHECHVNHHRGDRRFKNLPGTIFERLVDLFGGPKFNEIYQRSQHYSPPHAFVQQMSGYPPVTDPTVPSMLELAVAYGLHMARTAGATENGEEMAKLVRRGAESLNTMNDSERCLFWDFMTIKPGKN